MVVHTPGGRSELAFPLSRRRRGDVAAVVRLLTAFDAADRARRNARTAAVALASARAERRKVDAFLADHASASAPPP